MALVVLLAGCGAAAPGAPPDALATGLPPTAPADDPWVCPGLLTSTAEGLLGERYEGDGASYGRTTWAPGDTGLTCSVRGADGGYLSVRADAADPGYGWAEGLDERRADLGDGGTEPAADGSVAVEVAGTGFGLVRREGRGTVGTFACDAPVALPQGGATTSRPYLRVDLRDTDAGRDGDQVARVRALLVSWAPYLCSTDPLPDGAGPTGA